MMNRQKVNRMNLVRAAEDCTRMRTGSVGGTIIRVGRTVRWTRQSQRMTRFCLGSGNCVTIMKMQNWRKRSRVVRNQRSNRPPLMRQPTPPNTLIRLNLPDYLKLVLVVVMLRKLLQYLPKTIPPPKWCTGYNNFKVGQMPSGYSPLVN
uniref:Uncharacterized protein n=1 Tax=Cacopsylla melanoneura TaxID=428564 RepID=A0A8D8M0P1_9HEMI